MRGVMADCLAGVAGSSPYGRSAPRNALSRVGREEREAALTTGAASLIPQTLEEMAADPEHAGHAARVAAAGQAALTREERRRRQRALDSIDAPSFLSTLAVSLRSGCHE